MFIEVEENRFINVTSINEIMIDRTYKTVTFQLPGGEVIESKFGKVGEFLIYVEDVLKAISKADDIKKYEA